MPWTPVNPAHSIERVRFVLKFRENVPSKLSRQMGERVGKQRHETRLDGPIPLSGFNFAVHLSNEGQQLVSPPQSTSPGWQFSRTASTGEPIETIAVAGDQLIYETAEYKRWDAFKQRLSRIAGESIMTASLTLDIDFVSLEYFDRFVYQGSNTQAAPTKLLRGLEHQLPTDALEGRTLWHVHRGWFEKSNGGDVLVNQNFDANEGIPPGGQSAVRTVTILTKVDLRAGSFHFGDDSVLSKLDFLHEVSKSQFRNAVQPEVLRSVGILD